MELCQKMLVLDQQPMQHVLVQHRDASLQPRLKQQQSLHVTASRRNLSVGWWLWLSVLNLPVGQWL